MATFYLINTVTVAGIKIFAGDLVNDAVEDAPTIRSAGGLLWPSSDAVIAAAAAHAQSARLNRGANELELDAIMQAAVDAVQIAADTAEGPIAVASEAALSATVTAGMLEGAKVYVATWRTHAELRFAALTLRPHSLLASDDPAKVWVRSMAPTSWSYQYSWFYNATTGDDEADGSKTTPIKTLDEIWRRIRVFSAGVNGVQTQYLINLQTDVSATDSHFPSGIVQADGVQIGQPFGETLFAINMIGFRRAIAVPGGSGLLTAASALASVAGRTKATLTDSLALFAGFEDSQVMVADTATAASGTGVAASLAAVAGIVTLTGGAGFVTGSVNRMVIISGAATAANNGAFPITEFISATSIKYSNPNATASDANNGAITWTEKPSKMTLIANAPAFTTGSFAGGVTAISAGIATLAGAPAATFTSAAVGKRIRLSGNATGANNVDATILEFVSDTSVKIANLAAVVDVSATTFQGVVEVGPTWYDTATLLQTSAAPSTGSPYALIQLAVMPLRSWGAGLPRGLSPVYTDCQMSNDAGVSSGADVRLVTCRVTGNVALTGAGWSAARVGVQSLIFGTLTGWRSPSAFGSYICSENGYQRFADCLFTNYNVLLRENGPQITAINSMIQGGYFGLPGEEAGTRMGSGLGISIGGVRGLAVFNNVENSNIHPTVASGSAGAAVILGRQSRAVTAGSTGPQGAGKFWGVGALVGMHVKERSTFLAGTFGMPVLTDAAGQAGFPVREVKFDADAPIPVPSAVTGVPTAIATTSGVATTFVALNGIVTITDPAAVFTAASVGRTVTIAGATTPANNGTYPIESFIGATSVTIRNPAGVTDAVPAGTMTENPVVTRWTQLWAAPYLGNAVNHQNGSAVARVAEA